MTTIANVPIENPRAQCIVMLFAALHEMQGCHSKQDTISFIREHNWFDIVSIRIFWAWQVAGRWNE
jgi:hypothetical protein